MIEGMLAMIDGHRDASAAGFTALNRWIGLTQTAE